MDPCGLNGHTHYIVYNGDFIYNIYFLTHTFLSINIYIYIVFNLFIFKCIFIYIYIYKYALKNK